MTDEEKKAAEEAARKQEEEAKFNETQKVRVNEIVTERLSEQQAKHAEELARIQKEFEAKLEEAIKGKKKAGTEGEEDPVKKQYEQLLADEKNKAKSAEELAHKRAKENEDLNQRLRAKDKEDAIRKACDGLNFLEMDDVLALTQSKIEYDEQSKQFVVRENGIIKQDDTLKPMKLKDYYKQWADSRPHMVSAEAVGGAGSSESRGGGHGNGTVIRSKADLQKLPKDEQIKAKVEFIKKHGFAKWEALPLK